MGMSSEQLDALARALASTSPRRSALAALLAAAMPTAAEAGDRCKARDSEKAILRYIDQAARKYGQSKSVMIRVARCESNLDPCAYSRKGPYYGLYQYLKSTWRSTPYHDHDIYDPKAQAMATGWMWKKGRKNEWACK
jgi:soluble lytic murein transglycosylase-like protein